MPEQVTVRRADANDAPALAAIGSSSFRDAYGPHSKPTDVEMHLAEHFSPQAVERAIASGASHYLLASVNDKPAGLVRFRQAECPGPGGDANAVEIQQLYVLADAQGHGLGRRLVEQVIAAAREQQVTGVWLSAWELADWATGFYRRAGFNEIGKVEFSLGETSYTDILFWQPLD